MNTTLGTTNTSALDDDKPFDISKLSYVTVPLFTLIGLIGNGITVCVMFGKLFRQKSIGVYLAALAFSDTAFIIVSPFTKSFIKDMFTYDPTALSETGCKMFFFVFRSAKICSSWFVVGICIERFIVIWFPFKAKLLTNKRVSITYVTTVAVCVFIFDGVWTITGGIVKGVCFPSLVTESTKDLSAGFVVAGTLIFSIIPTCVLVLFTPLTVFRLCRQVHARRQMTSVATGDGYSDAMKITRMLIAVVMAYIILVAPISVAHSVAFFRGQNIFTSKDPEFIIFREIASILEQLNYSINFFLYFFCNATFRRSVYVLFGCRKMRVDMRGQRSGGQVPAHVHVSCSPSSSEDTVSSRLPYIS